MTMKGKLKVSEEHDNVMMGSEAGEVDKGLIHEFGLHLLCQWSVRIHICFW